MATDQTLIDLMREDSGIAASPDRLLAIGTLADEAASVQDAIKELERTLSEKQKRLKEIRHTELVDLLIDAGVDHIGVPGRNLDAKLEQFVHANIPADWPEQQREEAFNLVTRLGGEDLIKVTVSVVFGRREYHQAIKLRERLENAGYFPKVEKGVQWNTYTAWIKDQLPAWVLRWDREAQIQPPPPEALPPRHIMERILGATIGWVVKLKERR